MYSPYFHNPSRAAGATPSRLLSPHHSQSSATAVVTTRVRVEGVPVEFLVDGDVAGVVHPCQQRGGGTVVLGKDEGPVGGDMGSRGGWAGGRTRVSVAWYNRVDRRLWVCLEGLNNRKEPTR